MMENVAKPRRPSPWENNLKNHLNAATKGKDVLYTISELNVPNRLLRQVTLDGKPIVLTGISRTLASELEASQIYQVGNWMEGNSNTVGNSLIYADFEFIPI